MILLKKGDEEIIRKLSQRKDILLEEIEKEPSAIKKYALSQEVKDGLPDEAKNLIEQEVETSGELTVLISDDFENKKTETRYELENENEYDVKFIEEPSGLKSSEQVTVKGLALDSTLVLDSGEEPALKVNAPQKMGLIGTQDTLVIRFNWQNDTAEPFSKSSYRYRDVIVEQTLMMRFIRIIRIVSFLFPEIQNNITTNWYTIAYNKGVGCTYSGPGNHVDLWATAASTAASAHYTLANYDKIIYLFPDNPSCGWIGLGEVGGDETWINGVNDSELYAHELGHNVGLGHASSKDCGTKAIDNYASCSNSEYGDP